MVIEKSRLLILFIMMFFLVCINTEKAEANNSAREYGLDGACLDIHLENNLVGLDYFLGSGAEKEDLLHQVNSIPPDVLAKETWMFQVPVVTESSKELGFYGRKVGWYWMTGDSIRLVNDYELTSISRWMYYRLGYQSENYSQFGVYTTRKYDTGGIRNVFRGDLFLISDYNKMEITGQGRLYTEIDNSVHTKISGGYCKETIEETGFGGSVSYANKVLLGSGMEFKIYLRNLFSVVYFPSLTQENGEIDNVQRSISPIYVSGFRRTEAVFKTLPLESVAIISSPIHGGTAEIIIANIEKVTTFSLGYVHPLKNGLNMTCGIDPIMNNMKLGLLWGKGELEASLCPENLKIRGLNVLLPF